MSDLGVVLAILGTASAVLGTVAAWLQLKRGRSTSANKRRLWRPAGRDLEISWPTSTHARTWEAYVKFSPTTIGSFTIDASMRVGNLTTSWEEPLVHASYRPEGCPQVPRSVREVYQRNIQNRIAEARRDGVVMFDGPSYALCDYQLVVDNPLAKSTRLELLLGPSTYFDYTATNLSVPHGDLPSEILRRLPTMDVSDLPLSNQLGVNFSVITSDNMLVMQRRSSRVANYPRHLANGVNGTMQRGVGAYPGDESETGDPDPLATVRRECKEEIGIEPDRSSIVTYGLAVDHRYYQPLLLGEINIGATFAEVRSAAMAWAQDKFEYSNFECLPLSTKKVSESFMTDTWMPICALTTLATLIHRTGRAAVQHSFLKGSEYVIG